MRQTGNELQKMLGGVGCDIVDSTDGDFTPRKGKIYAIIVRENNTQIGHIKEDNEGTITKVTNRSWIGGPATASTGGDSTETFPTLIANEFIVPDYPVTEIEVTAGSVMVYYDIYPWKHINE